MKGARRGQGGGGHGGGGGVNIHDKKLKKSMRWQHISNHIHGENIV